MSRKKRITRRNFVKKSAVGVTAMAMSASSYARILGANERVNVVVAGLNGRGQGHLRVLTLLENANVAAICDVDEMVFAKSQENLEEHGGAVAKTYKDIRKALENKDIDAVSIATPDHWHAPMAILAMQAGKHVFLEKPCCHNPREGELLIEAEKKYGKVLQIGNQQRSAPTSIEAMEDIKEGIIGDVYYGKAWYANTRGSIERGVAAPVPDGLDWDLWQGPAPRKKFMDNYVHYNWHWFWHWGTGEINNNGLHEMDICRWALGVDYPTRVSSAGGRFHFDDDWEFYDTQNASFEFEGGKMLSWEGKSCNGLNFYERGRGCTLHGTEGSIMLDRNAYMAYDLKGNLLKQVNERSYSATTDTVGIGGLDVFHTRNFLNAIRKGEGLNSPILEAHKSTLLCHLGNMAQKFGRSLDVDPKTGKVLNDKDAMSLWGRTYEPGWEPKV